MMTSSRTVRSRWFLNRCPTSGRFPTNGTWLLLLTVLSRIGANSKVVLTHDVAQRDNLRVGRHDGIVAVVEKLKGHPLFAHVTLTRSERSPVAALVTEMLEDVTL